MANLDDNEKLFVVCEKIEYTWILHKFSDMINKDEQDLLEKIESPEFPENQRTYKWKLCFYPKEIKRRRNFAVYLTLLNEHNDVAVEYSFSLRNSDEQVIKPLVSEKAVFNEDDYDTWGLEDMIRLDELLTSIKDDNILKICVVVSTEVFTLHSYHTLCNLDKEEIYLAKLPSELETSIKTDKFHDFKIKVNNGTEIPIHRNILAARSPVFASMFDHCHIEKELANVEIKDLDESTMFHLLNFVYTGQLKTDDDLSNDEMKKLFVAADKYAIVDLRKHCLKTLIRNLTISNVLDVLIFSEIHSEPELKNAAFDYIIANFWKFCRPEKLEKMKIYPTLFSEIVSKIFRLCQSKFEIKL